MATNTWRKFSSSADALTALQNIVNTWYASGNDALNAVQNIVETWYASWDDALQDVVDIVNWTPSYVSNSSYTNTTPYKPFSTADSLRLQQQGYQQLGNDTLANAYWNLWSWADSYANTANQITGFYNALANDVSNRENTLGQSKYNLAYQLNQDLLNNRDYVMDMFWPNGTLTNEVNQYYTDMWNYLSTEAGREAANIAAQSVHSGASLWAIRAQQNEAYNNAYNRYLQAKEKEINAKQQIASNLINYMSTLRKEYWDTTNQYIISQYQRANDLLNSIGSDLTNQYVQLASARLSAKTSWGWSSSSSLSTKELLKRAWATDEQIAAIEWILSPKEEKKDNNKSVSKWANQVDSAKKPTWNPYWIDFDWWDLAWTIAAPTIYPVYKFIKSITD